MPPAVRSVAPARIPVALGSRRARTTLDAVGAALIALYLGVFAVRNVSIQGDFRTYLVATKASMLGLDPYRHEVLTSLAGRPIVPFVYPPVALVAFMPLTRLEPAAAAAVWIGAKLVLVAALVLVWLRGFAPAAGLLPLALVTVFGWNQALLWDLRAGNIAVIECALLWSAFACFVNGRRNAFAALVVACACFKLLPAVFLLLLLVPVGGAVPSPRRCLVALAALGVVVAGPLWVGPASHWQRFVDVVPDAGTLGDANPGTLALATVLAQTAGLTGSVGRACATSAWAGFALALLAVSAPFVRRAWQRGDPQACVVAAVFLFVLLEPRPMAYGFLLLVPAPLIAAPRSFRGPVGRLLLALAISAQGLSRAVNVQSSSILYLYAPSLLALCLWLLILESEWRDSKSPVSLAGSDVRPALAA